MKNHFFALACALVIAGADTCLAALSITGFGSAQVVNFDSTVTDVNNGPFTGAGFQSTTTAGQLDSDSWAVTGWSDGALAFGATRTTANTDYTRGATAVAVTTGGMYAYTVGAGNVGLGFQPGGTDWAPGTLTLRIQNNTGQAIGSFDLSYVVYVRNDQARANTFNFSYSTDNSAYTAVSALDLTSTVAADALGLVSNNRSTTLSGFSVAAGDFFYLRWSGADAGGTGSRDEFVLDDISITAVPEPTTWAGLIFGAIFCGTQVVRRLRNKQAAQNC